MPTVTLLGPQRLRPTLAATFDLLGVTGQIAAVTAGWQEREAEVDEMRAHLGRPVVDLMLHQRCDRVFAAEPELFLAHRQRQNRLREMQQLYRYRLDFAIQPTRELLSREGDNELLDPEREAALAALQRLDAEHLVRIATVHRDFERHLAEASYPALDLERAEVFEILDASDALAIAGGHVAVLINRMRLLGLTEPQELPVVAWSAGAMVLAERIVLFHDSPPQGAGSSEVLDSGLGWYRGVVPLPHANRRLRLHDPIRIQLFARRFAPNACLLLDEGDAIHTRDGRWRLELHAESHAPGTKPIRKLAADGSVRELAA